MNRRSLIAGLAGALALVGIESVEAAQPWAPPKKKGAKTLPTLHPVIMDRNFTPLTIENTTAETTLYEYTIGANDLGVNRSFRMHLTGDYYINSGTPNFTIRIKYGSTTMYQATKSFSAEANRAPWEYDLLLNARDVTNAQLLTGHLWMAAAAATPTTGTGPINVVPEIYTPVRGSATEDSTTELVYAVTVQFGTAHGDVEIVRETALVHLE